MHSPQPEESGESQRDSPCSNTQPGAHSPGGGVEADLLWCLTSPVDLLGGPVPSCLPSPQLHPDPVFLQHADLIRFESPVPGLPSAGNTPSPIDPDSIQVLVGYEPDPADLALSSVPGQEMFDPRKHKFSYEELKPQPMLKKARKIFIPEGLKDDRYWARRRKNNVSAKRSREARRLKENQIGIRASFLEKENSALRMEVADLRKELGRTKNIVAKYKARQGLL